MRDEGFPKNSKSLCAKRSEIELTIEQKPRTSRSEQNTSVLPFAVEGDEVLEGCLWDLEFVGLSDGLSTAELVWLSLVLALHICGHILTGLLNIAGNIEGITRSLGDGKTVVESNTGGDGAET